MRLVCRQSILRSLQPRFGFCFSYPALDPSKHITMSKMPHNIFVDQYDIGEYPLLPHTGSIPPRTYEPKVIDIICAVLNQKGVMSKAGGNKQPQTMFTNDEGVQRVTYHSGAAGITSEVLAKWTDQPISRLMSSNIPNNIGTPQQLVATLLNKLAYTLVVKQSKYTWLKEQRKRHELSISYINNTFPETLGDFLNTYNEIIEINSLVSYNGLSDKILQPQTALEKHFLQQLVSANTQTGMCDEQEMVGDKANIVNRFMIWLHRQ